MKLNTLKDWEKAFNKSQLSLLKAESIKWIKHDIKRDNCIIPRTRTWMRRLDITEEDLDAKEDQSAPEGENRK